MTQLAAPTIRSQLSAALHPWDDCGEADCASVITDAGTDVSVEQVAAWAVATGEAYYNGETNGQQLQAILQHWGVPSSVISAPLSQSIPAALSRSHEVIVLIDSNDYGLPSPGSGIGHWLLAYGDNGGAYQVMQPLGQPPGGSLQSYSQSSLQQADQHLAVEIEVVLPKDRQAPPPPPGPGTKGKSGGPGIVLPAALLLAGGGGIAWWELHSNPDLRQRLAGDVRSATRRARGVF